MTSEMHARFSMMSIPVTVSDRLKIFSIEKPHIPIPEYQQEQEQMV